MFVYNARNSLSRCSNSTKIVVRLGFAPDPTEGAYSAPPDTLAGFKGPTSNGSEVRKDGREWQGRGEKGGEET